LHDSYSSAFDEAGRELELVRWLAPRVAWQRRLLELSRYSEAVDPSSTFHTDDRFQRLESAAQLVDL
jgi:hypothetical protein